MHLCGDPKPDDAKHSFVFSPHFDSPEAAVHILCVDHCCNDFFTEIKAEVAVLGFEKSSNYKLVKMKMSMRLI